MRENKQDLIRSIFKRDKVVTVEQLMSEVGIKEPMVRRYIGTINAISSINCNSKYYLLPSPSTFKESDLLDINGKVFHKSGRLQAALYHIVDQSPCGLNSTEIKAQLKTAVNDILPKMFSNKKIARTKISGVRGFVYLSLNTEKRKSQVAARRASLVEEKETTSPAEAPDLEMVVDVFLTMIKNPEFVAKGVALSLQRSGKTITTNKVNEIIEYYKISKKNF